MSHILKLILIGAIAIKVALFVLSPAGRSLIVDLIGTPAWADQAGIARDDRPNTGAEDAAGWGDRHGSGYEDTSGWDEDTDEY